MSSITDCTLVLRGEVGVRNLENDRRFSQAQVSVFLADCGLTVFIGLTRFRSDDPPHQVSDCLAPLLGCDKQCSGQLHFSHGETVPQRLEDHHRHSPERHSLCHPGSGEAAH